MRTISRASCPVCDSSGVEIYPSLVDWVFGSPGEWRMVKCRESGCGTLWLDPAPLPSDLGEAYSEYYTHQSDENWKPDLTSRTANTLAHWLLGYPRPTRPAVFTAGFARWLPRYVESLRFARCYLPFVPGGLVLDVGCGAGNQLELLQRAGWRTMGVDFDERAVAVARSRGLDVVVGDLGSAGFPKGHFDAVTMIHVIEHVPDPFETLVGARGILKPGGRLLVITPNARSWGHRRFGHSWRGLEPPRHLQIFTTPSLVSLCEAAGFHIEHETTSARDAVRMFFVSASARRGAESSSLTDATRIPVSYRAMGEIERAASLAGFRVGEEIRLLLRVPS